MKSEQWENSHNLCSGTRDAIYVRTLTGTKGEGLQCADIILDAHKMQNEPYNPAKEYW